MNELLIMLIVALVIAAVGFIMYVYFFSVGYGFSIAGIGVAMLILFRDSLTACTVIMCLLFIAYGARRLELRQDRNYGHMEDYKKYVSSTPILIPLVPIYSVKKHKWLVA